MLKGLLPTLKAEKKQNQKNPRDQRQNPQNQGQNEVSKTIGLNLLSNFQSVTKPLRAHIFSISGLRKVIITLSLILGFLLVLNYVFFIYVGELKADQDKLSNRVLQMAETEKKAISMDKKVTYYKKILGLRKLISPRAIFVYQNIAEGIEINKLTITYQSFEITATAQNIYAFTKLITNYLGGDYVSEIVLKRADFNTQTKEYGFTIGGVFK